jgi:uncharacterized membrane protein
MSGLNRAALLARMPLFFGFPLLSHLAVMLGRPWLQCTAVACAYAALFFDPLARGRFGAWAGLLLFTIVDLVMIRMGSGNYALYLPSVLIPCMMLAGFAPSLLPGREPLITRIAESISGPLSPEQRAYTRGVTWVWTVAVSGILLVTVALLLFWSPQAWSLFANFISYLVLGALFAGEYAVRRLRFPEKTPLNFRDFLRSVSSYRPH